MNVIVRVMVMGLMITVMQNDPVLAATDLAAVDHKAGDGKQMPSSPVTNVALQMHKGTVLAHKDSDVNNEHSNDVPVNMHDRVRAAYVSFKKKMATHYKTAGLVLASAAGLGYWWVKNKSKDGAANKTSAGRMGGSNNAGIDAQAAGGHKARTDNSMSGLRNKSDSRIGETDNLMGRNISTAVSGDGAKSAELSQLENKRGTVVSDNRKSADGSVLNLDNTGMVQSSAAPGGSRKKRENQGCDNGGAGTSGIENSGSYHENAVDNGSKADGIEVRTEQAEQKKKKDRYSVKKVSRAVVTAEVERVQNQILYDAFCAFRKTSVDADGVDLAKKYISEILAAVQAGANPDLPLHPEQAASMNVEVSDEAKQGLSDDIKEHTTLLTFMMHQLVSFNNDVSLTAEKCAMYEKYKQSIIELIDCGAHFYGTAVDITSPCSNEKYPLFFMALLSGEEDIVRRLLEKEQELYPAKPSELLKPMIVVSPDGSSSQEVSPLEYVFWICSKDKHREPYNAIISLLHDTYGARVSGDDALSTKMSLMAARTGHQQLVGEFLKNGGNVNVYVNIGDEELELGPTLLMNAAYSGSVSLVRYLIEQGASRNIQDAHQQTVLMYAAKSRCAKCVDMLLQYDDIQKQVHHKNDKGCNALEVALEQILNASKKSESDREMVQILRKHHVVVGDKPLIWRICNYAPEILSWLKAENGIVDSCTYEGVKSAVCNRCVTVPVLQFLFDHECQQSRVLDQQFFNHLLTSCINSGSYSFQTNVTSIIDLLLKHDKKMPIGSPLFKNAVSRKKGKVPVSAVEWVLSQSNVKTEVKLHMIELCADNLNEVLRLVMGSDMTFDKEELIATLLNRGADLNCCYKGQSIVEIAYHKHPHWWHKYVGILLKSNQIIGEKVYADIWQYMQSSFDWTLFKALIAHDKQLIDNHKLLVAQGENHEIPPLFVDTADATQGRVSTALSYVLSECSYNQGEYLKDIVYVLKASRQEQQVSVSVVQQLTLAGQVGKDALSSALEGCTTEQLRQYKQSIKELGQGSTSHSICIKNALALVQAGLDKQTVQDNMGQGNDDVSSMRVRLQPEQQDTPDGEGLNTLLSFESSREREAKERNFSLEDEVVSV